MGERHLTDVRIAVAGCAGRMGQALIHTIQSMDGCRVAGGTERAGSPALGRDVGDVAGVGTLGLTVSDDLAAVLAGADAILDFTAPAATVALADVAAQTNTVHIIGTTGMTDADDAAVALAAQKTVIVKAGNMSLGVNLLGVLAKKVAAALDEDWDIEIVEMHHRHKVDAPSGTALLLAEAAAEGRGIDLKTHSDRGRDGLTGARKRGDIGMAALRGGSVVGEHEVIFAAEGERVVLKHIATDRTIFTRGAIKAALWGQGKPPGLYSMLDVLGL